MLNISIDTKLGDLRLTIRPASEVNHFDIQIQGINFTTIVDEKMHIQDLEKLHDEIGELITLANKQ